MNQNEAVQQILDSGRSIRFGKGVVAKTTYISAGVVATWCIIASRMSENMIANVCLITVGILTTGFAIWFVVSTQKFARDNPAQAMLEGAELLEWQKMGLAAKGVGKLTSSPPVEGLLKFDKGENL